VPSEQVPTGPAADASTRSADTRPSDTGSSNTGTSVTRTVSDPLAIRALAHPVRVALLELLAHAGTLTATQASQRLGESPANCAFHLRTLAKYGYVEEAGGGRGRERPWRRVHESLIISSATDDPRVALAADEVGQYWMNASLERARVGMGLQKSWPREWHNRLPQQLAQVYLTPDEARQLARATADLLAPFSDRSDYPERRPPGAMPVEILRISYLLTHLMGDPVPANDTPDE
jgi:DNA-binding transcriptional ArsR family regulator